MLRLTLSQMRRSVGRLTGAGIAVLIGTAFLTATLLAGAVMNSALVTSVAAQYGDADLVVSGPAVTQADLAEIRSTDGVAAADPVETLFMQLGTGASASYQLVVPERSSAALEPQVATSGAFPTAADEIAVPEGLAARLDIGVGDTVTAMSTTFDDQGVPTDVTDELTVTGVLDDPDGAWSTSDGASVVTRDLYTRWSGDTADTAYRSVAVALDPGAGTDQVMSAVSAAITTPDVVVETKDEAALRTTAEQTGGSDVFTSVVLAFAAVALLVAALVIANTFQVLVAQRARTLALLRCVGADKGQIGRSVLIEALILGVVSSALGVVAGAGLVQLGLTVAGGSAWGVTLPSTIALTLTSVVVPVLVGTVVTLVASLGAARAATRVAPLAALRPAAAPRVGRRGGTARLVFSVLLTLGGGALLAGGVALGVSGQPELGLVAGILGGTSAFVGIVLGAVFWLPKVAGLLGRLLGATGPSGRLAAANTLRNPRRTTATATALLIGVTLVAMMSTGAASARSSLVGALDDQYPVDLTVSADLAVTGADGTATADPTALDDRTRSAVAGVDGVADVVALPGARVGAADTPDGSVEVLALTRQDAAGVVNDPTAFDSLADGVAVMSESTATMLRLSDGSTLALGSAPSSVQLTVAVNDMGSGTGTVYVTPATLEQVVPDVATSTLWVRETPDADPATVQSDVYDALADAPVYVYSAATERASIESVVDTMLAVIVGLLAAAVVIAVIGVANTLSLSVIERRRESAMLRAIGLSRAQLRLLLAMEGVLIAVVGAVCGLVLGLLFGWAGSATVLSVMGDVSLTVPWRDFGIVLVGAVVAGLVASVVPGRTAARTSPVEALGGE